MEKLVRSKKIGQNRKLITDANTYELRAHLMREFVSPIRNETRDQSKHKICVQVSTSFIYRSDSDGGSDRLPLVNSTKCSVNMVF